MKNIKNAVTRTISNIRTSLIGTISSVIKSNKTVYVRISDDEEIRDTKIVSPYGLFSLPVNNINGQIIFNNSSKKAVLLGVDNPNIPVEVNPGETVIYSQSGSYIFLKSDGKVYINGDLNVIGNIIFTGTSAKGVVQ